MGRRRGFGEVERRVSRAGQVRYRARYMMPNGNRFSRTLATKMDAESWLVAERSLIDRDQWSPPQARRASAEQHKAAADSNTVAAFAERYLTDPDRALRPNTVRGYRQLLATRILPRFADVALADVRLADIKSWRASMDLRTAAANAAAYRLLRCRRRSKAGRFRRLNCERFW